MKIVIIGTGNVATVLGWKIREAGHTLLQVVGRRAEAAAALAAEWSCGYSTGWDTIDRDADLYIAALSDGALEQLADSQATAPAGSALSLPGRLIVHTAGAISRDVLVPVSGRCGVLYPLQSLRAAIRPFPEIPLLVDATWPDDLESLEAFARTLSPKVSRAGDATRLKLHLAAVLVNNFTNYLYTLADSYCRAEGADFPLLLPIIRETAERLRSYRPEDSQTGPARRGDRTTIEKHLNLLSNYEKIKELYRLFTIQIEDHYRVRENSAP